jgi:hypothetical protein
MSLVVGLAPNAVSALQERLALIALASPDLTVVVLKNRADLVTLVKAAREGARPYLLDINARTFRASILLRAMGHSYVVDTGDDPGALAIAMGLSRRSARLRREVESMVLGGASHVICRGYYHRFMLRSRISTDVHWFPDTAPDWVIDHDWGAGDVNRVGTFGTTATPRSEAQRVYGQEVIEALQVGPGLEGILVGRGRGLDVLRARATAVGVSERMEFHEDLALQRLCEVMSGATWLTSWQSDDTAGWVRTTGKLPLALAMGRCVIASDVGEAARVLPPQLRLQGRRSVAAEIQSIVNAGAPSGWAREAKMLAERYRRSTTAQQLADVLAA